MEAVVAVAATVVEAVEAVVEAAGEGSPARMQRPWVEIAAGRKYDTETHRCQNTNTGHLSLHTGLLPLAFFAIPI